MNRTFIVTDGEYSDYGICGVFDDKEMAEAFIARWFPGAKIEEWLLNPGVRELRDGLSWFRVLMDRDGNVEACDEHPPMTGTINHPQKTVIFVHQNGSRHYQTYVCAKNQAGAVKVANERRIKAILEEEQKG